MTATRESPPWFAAPVSGSEGHCIPREQENGSAERSVAVPDPGVAALMTLSQ